MSNKVDLWNLTPSERNIRVWKQWWLLEVGLKEAKNTQIWLPHRKEGKPSLTVLSVSNLRGTLGKKDVCFFFNEPFRESQGLAKPLRNIFCQISVGVVILIVQSATSGSFRLVDNKFVYNKLYRATFFDSPKFWISA